MKQQKRKPRSERKARREQAAPLAELPADVFSFTADWPNLMTIRQAAQRCNVSEKLLYKLCDEGALFCIRLGASIRIPKAALLACMRKRETPAVPENSGGKEAPAARGERSSRQSRTPPRNWRDRFGL